MSELKNWYCVAVNSAAYYGKTEMVVEELKSVLLPSKSELIVINEPEMMKTGEYLVFISSKNFLKKKDDIIKLSCVSGIQSKGNIPYPFTEKEVSCFVKSIEKKDSSVSFKRGDVVIIKEGSFKNLFGLVCGNRKGKVNVLFRFYVRDFHEFFDPKELKLDKNIFDFMPSNIDRQDWFKKFTE